MTIYSIQRDWGPDGGSVVRIRTDSNLEDIVQTDWLFLQEAEIERVNNGPFEWRVDDVALLKIINPANGNIIAADQFVVFPDFRSLNPIPPIYPNLQNQTAHAGGGQANALQLPIGLIVIEVVATAGDSVKLPDDVLGQTVIVYNRGANSMDVFPFLGDSINERATNAALPVASGARVTFNGAKTLKWISFTDATP